VELLPKQLQATKTTLQAISGLTDVALLLYGGAIRGGKTYWALITALMLCEIYPGSRWAVVRKDLQRIQENTIPSFNKILEENPFLHGTLKYSPYINYTYYNGSKILFRGENLDRDPDLDKYKGFETNGFIFEEMNEISLKMLWKGFERAGSWIIPNIETQPKPFIMGTCNPTQQWVKELIYDPYEAGTLRKNWVYIPAKITDNNKLPQTYIDSLKNLPRYEYMVYVEGNWNVRLKTGGEFFKAFEVENHIKNIYYDDKELIHVSIDSNVLPYIAISLWQVKKTVNGYKLKKFDEIPAEYPHNSARKAGKLLIEYLKKINYNQKIKLYGDSTTKARNNIDDENRSFFTLFNKPLKDAGYTVEDKFFSANPPVSATAEFINEIFENEIYSTSIEIGENCKKTISDYIEIKEDKDGGMLKKRTVNPETKASYELYGHFLDTDRYFICKVLEHEFNRFRLRLTNYKDETIPDMPESFILGGI